MSRDRRFGTMLGLLALLWAEMSMGGGIGPHFVNNEYNGNPNDTFPCAGTENPIHIGSGNKYHEETIFRGGGEFPLEFKVFYNSQQHNGSKLEGRWTYSYGQSLKFNGNMVELLRPDGRSLFFEDKGTYQYYSVVDGQAGQDGSRYLLGKFERISSSLFRYTSLDGIQEDYDARGRIIKVKNLQGGGTHLVAHDYDSEGAFYSVVTYKLIVTHVESGKKLKIPLKHFGQGAAIQWVPDAVVSPEHGYYFSYDEGVWCISCPPPPETAILKKITWPDGAYTKFSYNVSSATNGNWQYATALTNIDAYNNKGVKQFTALYQYDANGNAVRSRHGNADISLDQTVAVQNVADPDHSPRVVTNRLGHQTTYTFGLASGTVRLTNVKGYPLGNCAGNNTSYSYDSLGLLDTVTTDSSVIDYDNITNGSDLNTVALPSRVTYRGADNGLDRLVNYSWTSPSQVDGGYRLLKKVVRPGLTVEFAYTNGRIAKRTETDTRAVPAGYQRAHTMVRDWNYGYTYHGGDPNRVQTLTITGPRGDNTVYQYDTVGNLIQITNHLGHTYAFSGHNEFALPASMVDPNGVTSDLEYNPRGWLKRVTTAGQTTAFEYGARGQLVQITFGDNTYLRYEYTDGGRLKNIRNQKGEYTTLTRNRTGGYEDVVTSTYESTGALRGQNAARYDALGRLWKMYDLGGVSGSAVLQEFNYDARGNLQYLKDSAGTVQQFFDTVGRVYRTVDQRDLSATLQIGYDTQDRVVSVNDPEGKTTIYHYDGFGNLLQSDSPDTGTTRYYYDNAGNVIGKVAADGRRTNYVYDLLNRLAAVDHATDPDITFEHDATITSGVANYGVGQITAATKSNGQRINWVYDARGNVIRDIRYFDGKTYTTRYTYDLADNVESITYPTGNVIDFLRQNGTLTTISLRGTGIAFANNIAYEPFGPVKAFTYANGISYNEVFDALYRTDTVSAGNVLKLDYGYDSRSLVTPITDLTGGARGQELQYDGAGRLKAAVGNYGTYGYDYDRVGNRTALAWQEGAESFSETYAYAPGTHRLASVTGSGSGSQTRTMDYSPVGSLTADTGLNFTYDDSGRLIEAKASGLKLGTYTYNPLGERQTKMVGSENRHFIYGLNGELLYEGLADKRWQRDYIYLDGRLIAFADRDSGWTGAYDTGGSAPTLYKVGSTATITQQGLADGKSYFAYRPAAGDGSLSVQLASLPASVDGTEVGLELRESKTATANFVRVSRYSDRDLVIISGDILIPIVLPQKDYVRVTYQDVTGLHTLEEPLGSYQFFKVEQLGGIARAYASADGVTWIQLGPQVALNVTASMVAGFRVDGLPGGGSVSLQQIVAEGAIGDDRRFYAVHTDRLGSPQVVTDSSKAIVWSAIYSPFGEVRLLKDLVENNVRFPGQYFDAETGLHYNYFRDYDPSVGRYIESDPIGLRGGLNTYTYVGADPISYIDPLGLMEVLNVDGVSFHAYPEANGNETARRGPHGEYHVHLNGDKKKIVNVYTLEPENPDALTKKEKKVLESLSENQKAYLKKSCREVFHTRDGAKLKNKLIRLRLRFFGGVLGAGAAALTSNSHLDTCDMDFQGDLGEVCDGY